MLIGILETGHAPAELRARAGSYPELFQRLLAGFGFDFRTWSVVEMEFPDTPDAADGWLITGSRHGAYDDLPFIAPLEDFIRRIHASGKPLVGICFGHQIIAQALGGKVDKHPGGWAVGPQDYDFGGTNLRLNAWHQDQVTHAPEGAEVIASNAFCPIAGLRYGGNIWSVQPHPEFDNDFIAGLIETRGRGVVPDPLLDQAEARLQGATDAATLARQIADFFHKPRHSG
ncbi:type 1 glutamine amidotransferase [Alkalilacustris brevis]|uniref:type 1 glutamine amidotransferase n=1 Tax=Alkalilacustris brevis TaxID=2026338 RepID=UPI000E0CD6F1|nr:type 1 glutamine amidotransferase [Alkalilacustris brevis]